MPPKKKDQPKTAPKAVVDKTFGLKNVSGAPPTLPALTVAEK